MLRSSAVRRAAMALPSVAVALSLSGAAAPTSHRWFVTLVTYSPYGIVAAESYPEAS